MGLVWTRLSGAFKSFNESVRLSFCLFDRFKPFSKGPSKVPLNDLNEYDRVIRDEIDNANAKVDEGRDDEEKDLLPNCDLTVWLRDYKDEVLRPLQGTTSGNIPNWLSGTLIRNGPGSLTVGDYSFNHLFDASATLHRFHIKNGIVTYQSRLLRTTTLERNLAAQRIVVSEFGTKRVPDPCKTIFQKFVSQFTMEEDSDNCLVSVYPFNDEVYTLTETPVMYRIDPNSLETLGSVNVSKKVAIVHHTSHPHVEEDGLVYNIGLSVQLSGPMYTIFQFPNTRRTENVQMKDIFSEAKIAAKVPCRWPFHPGYMHSFGMTDNYFIIVEQPMSVSVAAKIYSNFNEEPLSNILKWYGDFPTLIHVLDKIKGNKLATFLAEPFFYLHVINQYEEDDHIVIDICTYKDPSMIDCMLLESLKTAKNNPDYSKMFRSRPARFVLPLRKTDGLEMNQVTLKNTKARAQSTENGEIYVIPEILCDMGCETPRVHYPKLLGKKYRYFYAISADVDLKSPGTLIKVDVQNKTRKTWTESGTFPSEPIFVPSPNQKGEDDGVILSTLLWSDDDSKVALVVLDAHTFTELGRSVFKAPGPVPKCLHGWFFPTQFK